MAWHGMEIGSLIGMAPHSQLRFQEGGMEGYVLWLINSAGKIDLVILGVIEACILP